MAKIILLRDVRLSFDVLGEPEAFQGKGKPRWSATFLVPASDPQKAMVDKVLEEVAVEKWAAKAKTHLLNILPDPKGCCWMDGARKAYDGYEGNFALSTHRPQDKGRPIVMDNDKSPIYQPNNELYPGKAGRIFAGCYVDAQVELWAQDNENGKGLRATLLVIQRRRTGDSFGGGTVPTADAFGEITEGADADDLS